MITLAMVLQNCTPAEVELGEDVLATVLERIGEAERAVDTIWVTFTAALVLFMQTDFAALEVRAGPLFGVAHHHPPRPALAVPSLAPCRDVYPSTHPFVHQLTCTLSASHPRAPPRQVGAVRTKNTRSLLLKNILDFSVGALTFWAVGYGVAFGGGTSNIGGDSFFFISRDVNAGGEAQAAAVEGALSHFVLLLAYACTSTTIVSGALAERTRLRAFLTFTGMSCWLLSTLPMRWTWSANGWLNPARTGVSSPDLLMGVGVVDYAGSGVVHMVGGVCALFGAMAVGPRLDERGVARFAEGVREHDFAPHGPALSILGAMCLAFSWLGFNAGSSLAIVGQEDIITSVVLTTVLSSASAMLFGCAVLLLMAREVNTLDLINCLLAGLVGITAGCSVVEPWASCVIGIISALIYILASAGLRRVHCDDPLDASALHGACGFFGVIAVGLFGEADRLEAVYGEGAGEHYGLFVGGGWRRLGAQVIGTIVYALWCAVLSWPLFQSIKHSDHIVRTIAAMCGSEKAAEELTMSVSERRKKLGDGLRVSMDVEITGIDVSHHAGLPYPPYLAPFIDSVNIVRDLQLASFEQTDPVPDISAGATSPVLSSRHDSERESSYHEFNLLLRPRVDELGAEGTVRGGNISSLPHSFTVVSPEHPASDVSQASTFSHSYSERRRAARALGTFGDIDDIQMAPSQADDL